ncbi:MAG: transposase [Roseburia sp.]|nr:transposase [Roseburia sp.]MDY4223663.1 transposase [Candidatus Limivicinus sp.]
MSEKIVQLNEEIIKGQLKELVRESVEETLNKLLEKEAESLTQAARYERNEARQGYRSGHYDRNLTTTFGNVTLHMPRLKGVSFETAIIERYRRRESSVEEALIEMYLAGVSVHRVEDITEALWGSKVSPPTISEDGIEETLTYCDFPSEHWTRIRTNNVIERLNREIRRRTRVVGTFPDGNSALMIVCARLRHVAGTQWGNKKYMNMKHLEAALNDVSIAG